jgi:hypothetical protein
VPQEGDTVPKRLLRLPTLSHGDITMYGTSFTPIDGDDCGVHHIKLQRKMATGNADDIDFAEGKSYQIAFAVHDAWVTTRDHWISVVQTLSFGAGAADIEAVKIPGTRPDAFAAMAGHHHVPREASQLVPAGNLVPGVPHRPEHGQGVDRSGHRAAGRSDAWRCGREGHRRGLLGLPYRHQHRAIHGLPV